MTNGNVNRSKDPSGKVITIIRIQCCFRILKHLYIPDPDLAVVCFAPGDVVGVTVVRGTAVAVCAGCDEPPFAQPK